MFKKNLFFAAVGLVFFAGAQKLPAQSMLDTLNGLVEFRMSGEPEIQSMNGFSGYAYHDSLLAILALQKNFMGPGESYPQGEEMKEFFSGMRSGLEIPRSKEILLKDTMVQGAEGQIYLFEESTTAGDGKPQIWHWLYFVAGGHIYSFLFLVPKEESWKYEMEKSEFFRSIRILGNVNDLNRDAASQSESRKEGIKLTPYERGKRFGYGIGMLAVTCAGIFLLVYKLRKNKKQP